MSNTTADPGPRSHEETAGAVVQVSTPAETPDGAKPAKAIVGRSPGQLAWIRLKRDRSAFGSFITVVVFIVIALAAPLISRLYGITPTEGFSSKLNFEGIPLGYAGGMSAEHWLGLEAGSGRDLFMQLIYGLRTSLIIAFASAIISIAVGVVVGIVSGYFGGWVDSALTWLTDLMLAFPFLVFALAIIPIVNAAAYDVGEEVPGSFRISVIIGVFALFGWMTTARLVRGQVLSLREREYVEAARAAGAGAGHILFRQLLPNIWAPILVSFSLALPGFIAAEAALSFLNIGVVEPTPDLGRLVFYGRQWLGNDATSYYFLIPAGTVFIVVLAFNLLGDSLRDALDPKAGK